MKQGIFISYRRDTGSTMARMIYDRLRLEKEYRCFLDVEKLNAGDFHQNILREMDKCDIFLLVLSKNALNRCVNPGDNVRREIESALKRKLAIIPVTSEDFTWPERMPEGLESIENYNSIPYIQVYSEQFFERLYSFIETIRAEEQAEENADPDAEGAAGMAERPAVAKEKPGEPGRSAWRSAAEAASAAAGSAAAPTPAGAPQTPERPARDTKKKTLPILACAVIVVVLLALSGIRLLGKNRGAGPLPEMTPAAAAEAAAGQEQTENEPPAPTNAPAGGFPAAEDAAPEAQALPESFLREMEDLAAKRLSGLLTENSIVEFGFDDGSTRDVDTRVLQLEDMELGKDALYFETGGTAALYLYYQGTVRISGDEGGEYPDAVAAFRLDSFPQKFYSVSSGGEIRYENKDFRVFLIAASKEEYLRRVHGSYQYVDHETYELLLP